MERVRDFRDIPLLFTEGEGKMGSVRKTTPERLDKIIQFTWEYQQKHNGETPTLEVIGRHVGVAAQGMGYYATMLVDAGRIDRISVRPFRATINMHHPANVKAIERYKRLLAKKEEHEENERQRIRNEQDHVRASEQLTSDREAIFEVAGAGTVVADRAEAEVRHAPETRSFMASDNRPPAPMQDPDVAKVHRFNEAHSEVRAANRDIRQLMPRLLKIADERDLVMELINRGYTVKKG
jgi:hypothetical protein